MTNIITNF